MKSNGSIGPKLPLRLMQSPDKRSMEQFTYWSIGWFDQGNQLIAYIGFDQVKTMQNPEKLTSWSFVMTSTSAKFTLKALGRGIW